MAKAFHPDRLAGSDSSPSEVKMAEDKMKDINAAYTWLKSNP
jgi:DnaJ-domain-containing protein 1